MKKFFLSVFVVTLSVLTISCGSDDDNNDEDNGGSQEQLTVNIDGQQLTFDSIIVGQTVFSDGTELDVTATIGGGTGRIITFYTYVGDVGANAILNFTYTLDGVYYSAFSSGTNLVTVVNVNNGARLEVNFSGILAGYDEVIQEEVFVTIENGTLLVDY